jgi:hypothetical protein
MERKAEAEMGMTATLAKRLLIWLYVHDWLRMQTLDEIFERWPRLRGV